MGEPQGSGGATAESERDQGPCPPLPTLTSPCASQPALLAVLLPLGLSEPPG